MDCEFSELKKKIETLKPLTVDSALPEDATNIYFDSIPDVETENYGIGQFNVSEEASDWLRPWGSKDCRFSFVAFGPGFNEDYYGVDDGDTIVIRNHDFNTVCKLYHADVMEQEGDADEESRSEFDCSRFFGKLFEAIFE